MSQTIDLGPQYPKDPPFTARMRFHQSWYRANVLRVPWGTGPKHNDTSMYGNMLRRADGQHGLNFLTPEIFAVARQRLEDVNGVIERFRLLHNMLSSQPMCFNLFGHLVSNRELARDVLQRFLPEPVAAVSNVVLEYAPTPQEEYLNDRTAFDAYIEFLRPDGRLGFVGVETKLTERFSKKVYDSLEYRHWSDRPDSPWLPEKRDQLPNVRHNQLWRDHLLAVALVRHPASTFASGYMMLVRHADDGECAGAVCGYRDLLKPNDRSVIDSPLDQLVAAVEAAVKTEADRDWIAAFRARYLDLSLSAAAWDARKRGSALLSGGS